VARQAVSRRRFVFGEPEEDVFPNIGGYGQAVSLQPLVSLRSLLVELQLFFF
jgi:hypothetical protein